MTIEEFTCEAEEIGLEVTEVRRGESMDVLTFDESVSMLLWPVKLSIKSNLKPIQTDGVSNFLTMFGDTSLTRCSFEKDQLHLVLKCVKRMLT